MQLHVFFHLCQFLWARHAFHFYPWRWPIESNAMLSLFYIVRVAIASWRFTELSSQNYIALWLEPWLLPYDITNTKSTCSHYLSLHMTGQILQYSCFWGKRKPGVFCCTKAKLICSHSRLLMQLAQGDWASVNPGNIWRFLYRTRVSRCVGQHMSAPNLDKSVQTGELCLNVAEQPGLMACFFIQLALLMSVRCWYRGNLTRRSLPTL